MRDSIDRLQTSLYGDILRPFSTLCSQYKSGKSSNIEMDVPGNGHKTFPQNSLAKVAIGRRSKGSPTLFLREHKRQNTLSTYQLILSGTRAQIQNASLAHHLT